VEASVTARDELAAKLREYVAEMTAEERERRIRAERRVVELTVELTELKKQVLRDLAQFQRVGADRGLTRTELECLRVVRTMRQGGGCGVTHYDANGCEVPCDHG